MAVRYFVSDVQKSTDFYVANFGFEVVEQWGPAFAIVSRDGQALWLSGPGTSAAKPMPDGRIPEPGGWNRIVISVQDLPTLAERLQTNGVAFRGELISGPGGSQLLIEDPDGNPIELFEPRS